MTPEEREDLISKIEAKLPELEDEDLMTIATEHDIHVQSGAEKMAKDGEVVVPPLINTDVLKGPIDGLKNFLLNKSRDSASK